MKRTQIRLQWQQTHWTRFRAGVSLHSHTHHSRESLNFLYRVAARVGLVRWAIQHGRRRHGAGFDLNRGWWTPPLVPLAAWELESGRIETELGLESLVSLTDHDSIAAPVSLRRLSGCATVPVSVEWTLPFGGTFFHLGVHNLPPAVGAQAMAAMRSYTRRPRPNVLGDLLEWLHQDPGTLIVLNHPLWDEKPVGEAAHRRAAEALLARHGDAIDALEWNGLRPWHENLLTGRLASAWDKPVISGGDRHGLEANSLLNLTTATSFAEFAAEVRQGYSDVLITHRYRRPLHLRVLNTVLDILGDHESHGLGWKSWDSRVFYHCDDGAIRSLKEIWGHQPPLIVGQFTLAARFLHRSWFQRTLGAALPDQQLATL